MNGIFYGIGVGPGDPELLTMKAIHAIEKVDVLIAPINGMYGNLDEDDCSKLSAALRPGTTIPCHYGMFASHGGDLKRFYDTMTEKQLPFLLMQQGEAVQLN